ncbi:hypothetical protein BD410DRAFT_845980 [Rickenella mellea]|uniref:Uncharacterized protein n=1 Tax=Rickenella mellea TaxID=50990 RepID=A0A4Y7PIY2_9AGAM|nr:hypothetical protein BD410DRAFT_845980 [Rickenella mellea]
MGTPPLLAPPALPSAAATPTASQLAVNPLLPAKHSGLSTMQIFDEEDEGWGGDWGGDNSEDGDIDTDGTCTDDEGIFE